MEQTQNEKKEFFEELSEESQQLLLSVGKKVSVKKGIYLFHEGDISNYIYLVISGKVRLNKATPDGRELTMHFKRENELVGEMGLFNDMSISVGAEVVEDSILIKFKKTELENVYLKNGEIAVTFMKWFTKNTQVMQTKFRDLIMYDKKGACYSTLIRFSNSYGVKTNEGILINTQLTNQEIANYIGTTRESVNRMLNKLKKENIINIEKKYISIKNIEYLKRHIQCDECPIEICTV